MDELDDMFFAELMGGPALEEPEEESSLENDLMLKMFEKIVHIEHCLEEMKKEEKSEDAKASLPVGMSPMLEGELY
jgi:hypothetical protein